MILVTLPQTVIDAAGHAVKASHRWEDVDVVIIAGRESDGSRVLGVSVISYDDAMRLSDQLKQYARTLR